MTTVIVARIRGRPDYPFDMADEAPAGGATSAWGNITTGSVTGTGIAIGHGAVAEGTTGIDGPSLASLFAAVRTEVQRRPEDAAVSKEELESHIGWIEEAAKEGSDGAAGKIGRWLGSLADVAPDIARTVALALVNPVAGVASAVQTVARLFLSPP